MLKTPQVCTLCVEIRLGTFTRLHPLPATGGAADSLKQQARGLKPRVRDARDSDGHAHTALSLAGRRPGLVASSSEL
jgi:hypothetical protein